jgi:hypothetical protein
MSPRPPAITVSPRRLHRSIRVRLLQLAFHRNRHRISNVELVGAENLNWIAEQDF